MKQTRFHIGEAPVSQSPIPCSPCPFFLTNRTSVEPPIPLVFRRATRHRRASPPLAHSPLRCRGGHDPVGPPHGGGKTVGEGKRRFAKNGCLKSEVVLHIHRTWPWSRDDIGQRQVDHITKRAWPNMASMLRPRGGCAPGVAARCSHYDINMHPLSLSHLDQLQTICCHLPVRVATHHVYPSWPYQSRMTTNWQQTGHRRLGTMEQKG